MNKATVISVNISEKKGTIKIPVEKIELNDQGVAGDAHAGKWHRQVSLLGIESIRRFEQKLNRPVQHGEFAENITTEGVELFSKHPLDILKIGEVELEISQIGKKCHGDGCQIFSQVGACVMPLEGIFARVIKGGEIKAGDVLECIPKVYTVQVITLSDRASHGVYEDISGKRIADLLSQHFEQNHKLYEIIYHLIPDDSDLLRKQIRHAIKRKADIIITTGGTGIGQRDITIETVQPMLTKEIPGIMEMIRVKYGQQKPSALLSRGVAGIIGETFIYTLPGSPKAVEEYLAEITKILDHSIYMLHGLDAH
jgi:molybdopterin adenylyltransferase